MAAVAFKPRPYATLRLAYIEARNAFKAFSKNVNLDDSEQYSEFRRLQQAMRRADRARRLHVWNDVEPTHDFECVRPLVLNVFPEMFNEGY
jgi:hypothetical protein